MDNNKKKKDNENPEFTITELFMVMADKERTYIGSMTRDKLNVNPCICRGKVKVENSKVYLKGDSEDKMWRAGDAMVILILDYGLHDLAGPKSEIFDTDFFHN